MLSRENELIRREKRMALFEIDDERDDGGVRSPYGG
jgi:hypothetical protein